ncbi:MAG: Rrf2 family transcriptional regulator [Oscillospiraceae bacterium]|nr:Rrf2 family transcriptional regulator [Oscillospiraceae bacterium]
MMISTRGRYALRVMIDLAEQSGEGYVPMKKVAERQGISLKYLEQILPALSKNNMIEGVHGKGGGYRLSRKPEEYTVGEILRLTEGELAPVACLETGAAPCSRKENCKTLSMWSGFFQLTNEYFDGITIADLVGSDRSGK